MKPTASSLRRASAHSTAALKFIQDRSPAPDGHEAEWHHLYPRERSSLNHIGNAGRRRRRTRRSDRGGADVSAIAVSGLAKLHLRTAHKNDFSPAGEPRSTGRKPSSARERAGWMPALMPVRKLEVTSRTSLRLLPRKLRTLLHSNRHSRLHHMCRRRLRRTRPQ